MTVKEQILAHIYAAFELWAADQKTACGRGCAACCSQNVTITALEGEQILGYVIAENLLPWFATCLEAAGDPPPRPGQTTNAYARAIIAGQASDSAEEQQSAGPCPFLEDQACRLYPVRPFACRSFISQTPCSAAHPALISEGYAAGTIATSQIIEHLGQRQSWGNMLHVLTALLGRPAYATIATELENPDRIGQAARATLTAEPLPGFLFSPDEQDQLAPLLRAIFSGQVGGKTIEDILNGR